MNKDQIAVSLMCMDFLKIKEQLEVLNEAKGYCTPALKRIMVKENMSEVQTIKTLLHEMAHAELHTIKLVLFSNAFLKLL